MTFKKPLNIADNEEVDLMEISKRFKELIDKHPEVVRDFIVSPFRSYRFWNSPLRKKEPV